MSLKSMIKNYKKPTPTRWRKIGDYVLLVTGLIPVQLPMLPIPDNHKVWIGAASTFLGITIKFWTNTKKDPDTELPAPNTPDEIHADDQP
jgi:hypothetical protein